MRSLKEWLHLLLTLPYPLRLGGTIFCGLLGLSIHFLTYPFTHSGNILAIPIAIAAWMFKKRGLSIYFTIVTCSLVAYHTLQLGTWLWPPALTIYVSSGLFLLLVEGLVIVALRDLLDVANNARDKAIEAEGHTAIAYEQQYQLNQVKDQFILNMNHELRTPLTELYGYLELLYEHNEELSSATRTRYIEHAFYASKELQQLTYNVLDTMQVDEHDTMLTAEEFVLNRLVNDVVKQLSVHQLQRYTIQVDIPPESRVYANEQAVRQVLQNLLSNVFKYTPAQTHIRIYTEQTPVLIDTSAYVQVCVQDDGPGIPPEEIPRLFARFIRLQRDVAGPVRGTGLGLYISRKLVERMGGRIWVESDGVPGHGSRFCFILPAANIKDE